MAQTKKNQIELSTDGSLIYVDNYCSLPTSNIRSFESLKDGSIVFHLIEPIQDEGIDSYTIDDASIDPKIEKRLNQIIQPSVVTLEKDTELIIRLIIRDGLGKVRITWDCISDVYKNDQGSLVVVLNQNLSPNFSHPSLYHYDGCPKCLILDRFLIQQKDLDQLDQLLNHHPQSSHQQNDESNHCRTATRLHHRLMLSKSKCVPHQIQLIDPDIQGMASGESVDLNCKREPLTCAKIESDDDQESLSLEQIIQDVIKSKLKQYTTNEPVERKMRMGIEFKRNDQYSPATVSLLITMHDVSAESIDGDESGNGLRLSIAEYEYQEEQIDSICDLINSRIHVGRPSNGSASLIKDIEIKHVKDEWYLIQFIRYHGPEMDMLKSAQEYLFHRNQLQNLLLQRQRLFASK